MRPDRVVVGADRDGEVAIYWFGREVLPGGSHNLYASLGFSRDGVSLCLKNRTNDSLLVREIEWSRDALETAVADAVSFVEAKA